MNRITFLESINGIQYPEMIVEFFDQFIALKEIVEDGANITVENKSDGAISFITSFKNTNCKNNALSILQSGSIIIYGRQISVVIEPLSETDLRFILK
jgi:hypothetical protein